MIRKILKIMLVSVMTISIFSTNLLKTVTASGNETLESLNEEEIPEITGESLMDKAKQSDYKNFDDVCKGGGEEGDRNGNPNSTNRPNQNPKTESPIGELYWEYDNNNNPFNQKYTEQQLIDKLWPKNIGEAQHHTWKLQDAVIDPEYRCFYANPKNGWGESVSNGIGGVVDNDRYYTRYNEQWGNGTKQASTPAPSSSATANGTPIFPPQYTNLAYAGNWTWRQGGSQAGTWKFTIATRPKLYMGAANTIDGMPLLYIDGNSHPRVYDNSADRAELISNDKILFKFIQYKGGSDTFYSAPGIQNFNGSTDYRKTPTNPGFYKVKLQTAANVGKFMLPGVSQFNAIYMKKGYTSSFVSQIDKGKEEKIEWNTNETPQGFDFDTQQLFNLDLYLPNQTYSIPIPKYDDNKYVFEGWDVVEQYYREASIGYPHGNIADKDPRALSKVGDGYEYKPSAIGENDHFVLGAKFVAKLRSKKAQTFNVETQVIEGKDIKAGLDVTPNEIKFEENTTTDKSFTASVQSGYAYDFVGWSDDKNNPTKLGKDANYQPTPDFLSDNKLIYATFKPKTYQIKFDGNGGTTDDQKTEVIQNVQYYDTVTLRKNEFQRSGFTFKGWSKTKDSNNKEYSDQGNVYNIPFNGAENDLNGKVPNEVTLYAVWERGVTNVDIHKHKDTLWIPRKDVWSSVATNIWVMPPDMNVPTNFNAYEITRFYLDVDITGMNTTIDKLDKSKFNVVWERSTNGGTSYEKIPLNLHDSFITAPFTNNKQLGAGKVEFDTVKQKWFVPLLVRALHDPTDQNIGGLYKVSVAYDDPTATTKVTSEEDFYAGKGNVGWKTSEPTEVKVVQEADTVISIPGQINMIETKESSQNGEKEIIVSAHKSNKVVLKKIMHTIDKVEDTNWHTPSNALENKKQDRDNSYNGLNGLHNEFIIQKPYSVSISWNGILQNSAKNYSIKNVQLYSASNIGSMQQDQVIPNDTKSEFMLDGSEDNKILFDFYLKADKPKDLPVGVQLKGTITFTITNGGK